MGLLFIAFLEERECVGKLVRTMNVSTFSFFNASNAEKPQIISHISRKTGLKNYAFCRNLAVNAGTRLTSLAW